MLRFSGSADRSIPAVGTCTLHTSSVGCPALTFSTSLQYTKNAAKAIRTKPAIAPITTPATMPPDGDPESDDENDIVEVAEALTAFSAVVAEIEAGLHRLFTSR